VATSASAHAVDRIEEPRLAGSDEARATPVGLLATGTFQKSLIEKGPFSTGWLIVLLVDVREESEDDRRGLDWCSEDL
jgi:hypothetical protein